VAAQPAFDNSLIAVRKAKPEDAPVCGRISRVPRTFAFFANVGGCVRQFTRGSGQYLLPGAPHISRSLRMCGRCVRPFYSRVRIISLGTNGQSSDQWSLLVISTHSGGEGTHTSLNARCVGHPA
jgi:hypothetical protein